MNRIPMRGMLCLIGFYGAVLSGIPTTTAEDKAPAPAEKPDLHAGLSNDLLILNVRASQRAPSVDIFSRRGDVHLFMGHFTKAVADYQQMLQLEPDLDASHWRLGIALFFDGHYPEAAAQFAKFHKIDQVDRENGIWQYFSMAKAKGVDAARKQILKYEKSDREPFDDIYELISGKLTGEELLKRVQDKKLTGPDLQNQLFYAELYIGLNEAVLGNTEEAKKHLQLAVDNPWPQQASYGPRYMWHVGRLELELLKETKPKK